MISFAFKIINYFYFIRYWCLLMILTQLKIARQIERVEENFLNFFLLALVIKLFLCFGHCLLPDFRQA